MLNEVKHLGQERGIGIAPEGTYDGHPGAPGLASAQHDNHRMTSEEALMFCSTSCDGSDNVWQRQGRRPWRWFMSIRKKPSPSCA